MSGFPCHDGILHAEDVPLPVLAEAVGTPFYVYSTAAITAAYHTLTEALAVEHPVTLAYAVKANDNMAVIRTLARLGAGADVVSVGELRKALAAGVPPSRIVYSGVGKTQDDLAEAVAAGIHQINVESVPELKALSAAAAAQGRTAPVAVRVNPDVDAMTLAQITTGTRDNKFGIDIEQAPQVYALARTLPGIDACAIAMHIGSQVANLEPYRHAYGRVAALARSLRADGFPISRLDLGGGFAITYRDEPPTDLTGHARLIRDVIGPLGCQVTLEPGRVLVGNAGLLVTRVIYVKTELARDFVIVDGAMNDLIRPALYKAYHAILPVREPPAGAPVGPYDVVGPVCESTDTFAERRPLAAPAAGDLLAFASAGAYGATMSSTYNARPLVPEVLVDGHRFAIVRKRPTFEEMVALEAMPPWLDGGG